MVNLAGSSTLEFADTRKRLVAVLDRRFTLVFFSSVFTRKEEPLPLIRSCVIVDFFKIRSAGFTF